MEPYYEIGFYLGVVVLIAQIYGLVLFAIEIIPNLLIGRDLESLPINFGSATVAIDHSVIKTSHLRMNRKMESLDLNDLTVRSDIDFSPKIDTPPTSNVTEFGKSTSNYFWSLIIFETNQETIALSEEKINEKVIVVPVSQWSSDLPKEMSFGSI